MPNVELPADAVEIGSFGKDRTWQTPDGRMFMEVEGEIRECKPLPRTTFSDLVVKLKEKYNTHA